MGDDSGGTTTDLRAKVQSRSHESVKGLLEHVRAIHFALVVAWSSLAYLMIAAHTDVRIVEEEVRDLEVFFTMTDPRRPAQRDTLALWNRNQLGKFETEFMEAMFRASKSRHASESQLRELEILVFPGRWTVKPPELTERMSVLRSWMETASLSVVVPRATGPCKVSPNAKPTKTAGNLFGGGLATLTLERQDSRTCAHIMIEGILTLGEGRQARSTYVKSESSFLLESESITVPPSPAFEERFPWLTRQWTSAKDETVTNLRSAAEKRRDSALKAHRIKLFDLEIEGSHAVGIVAFAMLAMSLYLLAYLRSLELYLAEARLDDRGALRLVWIGVQENIASKIILGASLLTGVIVLFWSTFELISADLRLYWFAAPALVALLSLLIARTVGRISKGLAEKGGSG